MHEEMVARLGRHHRAKHGQAPLGIESHDHGGIFPLRDEMVCKIENALGCKV